MTPIEKVAVVVIAIGWLVFMLVVLPA